MKRLVLFVIALALSVIFIPWLNPARADQNPTSVDVYQNNQLVKTVVFKIGVPYYVVNGKTPGVKMDVAPFIQNDRTFVPVRFLGNALGVTDDNIIWNNPNQVATLKGANATLQMTIGKAQVVSNGQAKAIDVAPVLTSDRTFLPARYVAEGLGYQVEWDETTQTVVCWPAGQVKPDVSTAVDWLASQVQQVQQPLPPQEQDGKPQAVRELENLFGVALHSDGVDGTAWYYSPTRTEQENNRNRSYFSLSYGNDGKIEYTLAEVCWSKILPDIRNVELDLSPVEKVLNLCFPGQPDKVQEIMVTVQQTAEKTRASNRTERAPWEDYYVDGYKVSVGSIGFNFAEVIIKKN